MAQGQKRSTGDRKTVLQQPSNQVNALVFMLAKTPDSGTGGEYITNSTVR